MVCAPRSHGGKVNHYLIAMDSTSKNLTLNGDKYFAHLPALVQVSFIVLFQEFETVYLLAVHIFVLCIILALVNSREAYNSTVS